MSSDAALSALRSNAKSVTLGAISGTSITLSGESYPFLTKCTFTSSGKTLTYSLISLFLLVQDPGISVLKYKQACKDHKVEDAVKILDKNIVLEYFRGGSGTVEEEGSIDERPADRKDLKEEKERPSAKKAKHKSRKRSSRDEDKTAAGGSKKKEKTAITQQDIMNNLNIVVDKRGEKSRSQQQESGGNAVDAEIIMDSSETANDAGSTVANGDEPPTVLSAAL